MSSPRHISIKIEIQIPVGVEAKILTGDQAEARDPEDDRGPCTGTCPTQYQTVQVGIPAGSGSMSGTGTICGWATFRTVYPQDVRALVIPAAQVTQQPPSTAQPGTSTMGGAKWVWASTNPIPGAAYSLSGAPNNLVIWYGSMSGGYAIKQVAFTGVPGSSDPCGYASGGGPCFSGTGIESVPRVASAGSKTFPAVWCVSVGGFAVAPLVLFNATWALRHVGESAHPTWTNGSNGVDSPSVRLKLCPKRGWELVLKYKDTEAATILPFEGNTFASLLFPNKKEQVAAIGIIEFPAIIAVPM